MRAAYDATTDMNNLLNTLSALANISPAPVPPGNAADGTAALATGETGAFAQLLGSFTLPPAVMLPVQETDSAVAGAPRQNVDIAATPLAPMPDIPADAPHPEQTMEATAAPQPDAALIAALLGQMQTPYTMPAPVTAVPASAAPAAATQVRARDLTPVSSALSVAPAVAPVPAFAPTTGGVLTTQKVTGAPAVADMSDAPDNEAITAPLPPPPGDYVAAAPRSGTDFDALAQAGGGDSATSDAPAAVAALRPPSELKAAPNAVLTDQAPVASPLPVARPADAAAAIAPVAHAPVQSETAQPTDHKDRDGALSASLSASSGADSIDHEGYAPPPAHLHRHDGFRHAVELKPVDYERDFTAAIVAAPAPAAGSATPPRTVAFKAPRDGSTDVAAGATPAAMPIRSDTLPQSGIAPYVGSPEWQPAFASSVKLLVKDGASAASLRLNPAEFGPIDVRITVTDQRADISFMVTHPDANAAIQSALSELRDQLAHSGIQLGQTSVGAHPQDSRQPGGAPQREAADSPIVVTPPAVSPPPTRPRSHGKIDIYA